MKRGEIRQEGEGRRMKGEGKEEGEGRKEGE